MQTQPNIQPSVENSSTVPSFFDLIDKNATYKAGKDLMAAYQSKRKQKGKKGGITANTFDLFFAIIRSVAPTMEDVRVHQEGLFDQCVEHGEFFCFTTIPSLIKMMNNLHQHKVLSVSVKTIYNQLQKLIEMGIITEKVNHVLTGRRNPYPSEQSPRGRGKIQLWISPSVLHILPIESGSSASDAPSFFAPIRERLPMYELRSLLYKDKELKTIVNTVSDVDNKASAVAESKPLNIQDKEQGSKSSISKAPNISPPNLSKKDFVRQKMWDLLRFNLYNNEQFNEQTSTDGKEMIGELLETAKQHVEQYRKEKIQSFRQNPAFLVTKNQNKMLYKFAETLPDAEKGAVEILSHAIVKQQKHAQKHGYQVYYPVNYLSSKSALDALNYSIADWSRIQANYFDKNKASKAYFEQIQWINKRYSSAIDEIQYIGYTKAYQYTGKHYNAWFQELKNNPYLKDDKIKALSDLFIQKFKPLFKHE